MLHTLALSPHGRSAQKIGAPPQRPEPGGRRGRRARRVMAVPVPYSARPTERRHLSAERRGVPTKRSYNLTSFKERIKSAATETIVPTRAMLFSMSHVQICQKSRRIGCVIPHCNLHCGITQPILPLFLTYIYYCTQLSLHYVQFGSDIVTTTL